MFVFMKNENTKIKKLILKKRLLKYLLNIYLFYFYFITNINKV